MRRDAEARIREFFKKAAVDYERGFIETPQISRRDRFAIAMYVAASGLAFIVFSVSFYVDWGAQYLTSEDAYQFIARGGPVPEDFTFDVIQAVAETVSLFSFTAFVLIGAYSVYRMFRTTRIHKN